MNVQAYKYFELDLLTIGMVLDIYIEKSNDGVKYSNVAGRTEFDKSFATFLKIMIYCNKLIPIIISNLMSVK